MRSGDLRNQVMIRSTRQNRFGETSGAWLTGIASSTSDMDVEILDLRDYPMPFFSKPSSPYGGHYAE